MKSLAMMAEKESGIVEDTVFPSLWDVTCDSKGGKK